MENKLETRNTTSEGSMTKKIIIVIFSFIEVILGFRFVFKLMGANPTNVFVKGLYAITQFFVGIFEGIFSIATTTGAETEAVFEPATLIAIVVVALIAWGILKLMSDRTSSVVKHSDVSTGQAVRTTVSPVQPEHTTVTPVQPEHATVTTVQPEQVEQTDHTDHNN